VHAYAVGGRRQDEACLRLLEMSNPSGVWSHDKWHLSWVYATWRVGVALLDSGYVQVVREAVDAVVRRQRTDGGWGAGATSTALETAYGVLLIDYARRRGIDNHGWADACSMAGDFLVEAVVRPPPAEGGPARWIGPDAYSMPRLDRLHELCGLLVVLPDRGA
jgi:hypothetical protein